MALIFGKQWCKIFGHRWKVLEKIGEGRTGTTIFYCKTCGKQQRIEGR